MGRIILSVRKYSTAALKISIVLALLGTFIDAGGCRHPSKNENTSTTSTTTSETTGTMSEPGQNPTSQTTPEINQPANTTISAVPEEFQSLYSALELKLDTMNNSLDSMWNGQPYSIIYGAELLPANGNQGEKLLLDKTYQGTLAYLDGLQAIGIKGVTVNISYPILTGSFPHSSEYLQYYKKLAAELKRRDIVFFAKTGPVFTNTPFSSFTIDFSGLTLDTFQQQLREQTETIINELHPDYLSIINEPTTITMLTGLQFTAANFTEAVNYVLNGLDRQGVKIGGGAGTWNDPSFISSLSANTSLDYIDLHLYPINRDYLNRVTSYADEAKSHNKKVVVGEAWLYKIDDDELASTGQIATQATIFGRDTYSFWEPLDIKFLTVLSKIANYKQFEYISPFWSQIFFSYVDYDQAKGLSYTDLSNLENSKASANIVSKIFSGTGTYYQTTINTFSH